jgi:type I restriction enzyme R subunit
MHSPFTESIIEEAALTWFKELGYDVVFGPTIAPEEQNAERLGWDEIILRERLRAALERINKSLPAEVLDEVVSRVCRTHSPNQVVNNHYFHRLLSKGVDVEYQGKDGRAVYDKAWLVDFEDPEKNDWLACNQFTVIESGRNRRADVVVFVNGLPLAVFELKNPADEAATVKAAFNQLQTYKKDIPGLFQYNELLLISDSLEARCGTISSNWERFMPWRTEDGISIARKGVSELGVAIKGMFEKQRLLDMIRNFVVFQRDDATLVKKLAGYHQFHAVNKAVDCTIKASRPKGDKRIGVIWHTQGSGKSLTMAFYAGKIVKHPAMTNPTLLVITDRNDLDDQLFGTFASCEEVIGQKPVQADNREHLQELLRVASGGVIFTTIQKFLPEKNTQYPLLTDRRNVVVIADEAHRSQYDFIDGFARHMRDGLPNASFVGFTGTPIEHADKSTPAVFGDYIDTYDIQRAVEDGATVPIYYEGRLAKIELREEERPKLDPEFEELTEREEVDRKEQLKSRWARLEALVGTEKRINLIARDIVTHFENRCTVLSGKAMIVGMSRRICVELYNAIIKIRPDWHHDDDLKGSIKVVMTGSASDPLDWQGHIRSKLRREELAARFKKPKDPLKLVIVRDMWLTGFDVPCLHTMYVDKPMRGHGLMQAIARVNRVFSNKPGGLVVDYLGLADQLKKALSEYSEGSREEAGVPLEEAVAVLLEKFEIVSAMFHGFDYSDFMSDHPVKRTEVIPKAMEHVLSLDDGRRRFMNAVTELSKAFALSVPHESALAIKDEVGFYQTVRAGLAKTGESDGGTSREDLDAAIRQLVSKAVASDEVIDIFRVAGLKNPDLSILSDEFLAELQGLPYKNLAIEVLKKLLGEAITRRAKTHLIEARSFREMLEKSIKEYQNRSIEAAAVIQHLIDLAKEMREANSRGEKLGLTEDELAFYDALEVNDSAVKILGDDILRAIAHDLVETVKRNVTIDWTVKESVRANLRRMVKRVLKQHGYPPDKQEKAVQTVLEQAETLCEHWAA